MGREFHNQEVYGKLSKISKAAKRSWMVILNEKGEALFKFPQNPETLTWDRSAKYSEGSIPGTTVQPFQYGYATGKKWKISKALADGYWQKKSIATISRDLEILLVGDPKSTIPAPKVLTIAWGGRKISNLVLTSINCKEIAFLSGEPVVAEYDLEFQEIPPSDADPTIRAKQKEKVREADKKAGKLTDRQRSEASIAGNKWLSDNKAKLPADLQSRVKAGTYKMSTAEKGEVSITDDKGKVIQAIGTYNGTKKAFTPAKSLVPTTGVTTDKDKSESEG